MTLTGTAARFCKACGARYASESAAFCKMCGAARPEAGAAALPTAAGIAGAVTAAGGLAAALPWRTIHAGEALDVGAFLAAVAPGAASKVVARSLKRPAIVLAFTVVTGVAVALLTGGTPALVSALPQVLTGTVAAVLALATGSKTGPLRAVTGVVSVVAALVALVSVGATLYQGIAGGDSFPSLLPSAVAAAAAVVAAAKTSLVALRRS